MFTDNAVTSVQYDNQTAYGIAISTYAVFSSTSTSAYIIPSGRTNYTAPLVLPSWKFQYAIMVGTTPASINLLIIK